MRRIFLFSFFILISIFVGNNRVEANVYTTTAVNGTRMIFNAGNGYLPAVVRGAAGGLAASRAGALIITPAGGGAIAAALAFSALTYGVDRFIKYLDDKDLPIDPGTKTPRKRITKLDPPPGFVNPMPMDEMIIVGYYGTYNEAYNAIVAYHAAGVTWPSVGHQYPQGGGSIDYVFCYDNYSHVWVAFYDEPSNSHETFSPATPQDVSDKVTQDLTNSDPAAQVALMDVLNRVNDSLKNLNDTLNKTSQKQTIQDVLDNSIPQTTKTELDNDLSDPNATDQYVDDAAEDAETRPTNNPTTTTQPDMTVIVPGYQPGAIASPYEQPEVGDFAERTQNFMNELKETTIFSLPGLLTANIPDGGQCETSIDCGQRFGGSHTVSICNWATGLAGIKVVLLVLASIAAVKIVAKGGA